MAMQGFGNNQLDSSKYDTRLLSWGGFLHYGDQKSEKDLRYLICLNTKAQTINIVQHENQHATFQFGDVMCVFENLKYENALIIFFKNEKPPVQFFLDAQLERDSLEAILKSIVKGDLANAALAAGVTAEEEVTVEKKGKLKWAKRHLVVTKSRVLLFRDKNKAQYPLQMMSLLEPEIHIRQSQHSSAFQIDCQERSFHFQMSSDTEAQNFIDKLQRKKDKMVSEAHAYQKLKVLQLSESKRNMVTKSVMVRQQMQSQRMLSKRNLNEKKDDALKVMLANGSVMHFDSKEDDGASSYAAKAHDKNRKVLKFDKQFKPHKHQSAIFIWGKARPPRLYPQHADQTTPFKHDQLTQKRFIYIAAAKDGTHVLGFTDNDWTFVWGEANYTGALGLGRETKSTLPFILKPLKKQKVIQVSCSSRHGLAITMNSTVYGWGAKNLTNLPADTSQPTPLPFLSNLGVTSIACSSTHSAAWHQNTADVYSWGIPGAWLGIADSNTKNFGRVEFDVSVTKNKDISVVKAECSNQYSFFLMSDGRVATCGVNEHGRMGIGQVTETATCRWVGGLDDVGEVSAGVFHAGFITMKGQLYTCGVGNDYRLGHGNTDTVFEPKLVESLQEVPLVRVQCVDDRTFAITKYGCALMWGCEPVTHMVHTAPFVYEYMRPFRIYQIIGTKDFTVALGVHAKNPVPRPDIEAPDNTIMQTKKTDALNSTIVNVINSGHQVSTKKGFAATNVYGNMIQVKKEEVIHSQPPGPPGPPGPPQAFGMGPPMGQSQMSVNPPPGPPPNFMPGPPMGNGSQMNFGGPPRGPPPPNAGFGGFIGGPPPNQQFGQFGAPPGPPPNQFGAPQGPPPNFNNFGQAPPQGPPPNFQAPPMQMQMQPPPGPPKQNSGNNVFNMNNGNNMNGNRGGMPPPGPPPNQMQAMPPPNQNMNNMNNLNGNGPPPGPPPNFQNFPMNGNGPPPGPPPNFNGGFQPFQYAAPPMRMQPMGQQPPPRQNQPPSKWGN